MASVISFAHTLSNFTHMRKSSVTFLNNKIEIYSQMFYVMAGDFISESMEKNLAFLTSVIIPVQITS